MDKRIKIKNEIRKSAVRYDELVSLSSDDCVKVSRIYFNFLMIKGNLLEIKDEKYWEILQKYSEIERMMEKIKKPRVYCPSYYLMSVEEVKYLIEISKEIPKVTTYLLKSDVKTNELNEKFEEIKKQYKIINNKKR